jgi:hypothetical protein
MTDDRRPDVLADLPLMSCPPDLARRLLDIPQRHPRRHGGRWRTWAASLAAAAALAVVLLATRPDPSPDYSAAELAEAREQTISSLSTVMSVIEKTQREAVSEVLGRQVPQTLGASVRKALQLSEGGQG